MKSNPWMRVMLWPAGLLLAGTVFPRGASAEPSAKPNVLFIAVDDLRPQLGCYGFDMMLTPRLDALAARGTLFDRAYCQQATCSPSRISLMTGRRPDTTRIYDLNTHLRTTMPDVITLPEHFRRNGYFTQAFGKIYHGGLDDERSWSVPALFTEAGGNRPPLAKSGRRTGLSAAPLGAQDRPGKAANPRRGGGGKPSWAILQPDEESRHVDTVVADSAIGAMRDYRKDPKRRPFFLAAGFRKPHLQFAAPQRFYDLYPLDRMPLAANPFPPKNSPPFPTTDDSGEVRSYTDIPPKSDGPISEMKARELIRGYFACVSYIDFLVGRLLDELERLGFGDNTIVVLWGDHGWHLGEHAQWGKHTNFEVATRVPLLIAAPGPMARGARTDRIAELIDIYPTLCELAGLPPSDGLEGVSLVPVLKDPRCAWDAVAISQWPRPFMGYSMRTDRYRYTEWIDPARPDNPPKGTELYDHETDPDENVNLAGLPEHAETVGELSRRLARERTRR